MTDEELALVEEALAALNALNDALQASREEEEGSSEAFWAEHRAAADYREEAEAEECEECRGGTHFA